MERTITLQLDVWRKKPVRKPLVLQGVRQCGKTYTLCEFGKNCFEKYEYFNFEKDSELGEIFKYDYNPTRILKELAQYKGIESIDIGNTLIIFDEVQECPRAITSLKYFCEDYPAMYLVAAGSLLGPAISHKNISFPVGKVEFLNMYPMSIYEYLLATGYNRELEMIKGYDLTRSLSDGMAERFEKACKQFFVIGGMPEVVNKWIETRSFEEVAKVQDEILEGYAHDFGKYLSPIHALKVGWIWDSVPLQLAKENNKFVFSHVKQGKRAADLEDAMLWLLKAGMIYQLELVETPQLPLSHYADATYFKVYMSDVGLLCRKSGLSASSVIGDSPLYSTFKGGFTENFVMSELVKQNHKPYFWRSGNSAEVDFMIESHDRVVPIESKAQNNTKAKSFKLFCSRFQPPIGFKLSMNNVGDNPIGDTIVYRLPLYLIWRLHSYLEQ